MVSLVTIRKIMGKERSWDLKGEKVKILLST
jgi:hypothetical protein